jgi:hypothetical protein
MSPSCHQLFLIPSDFGREGEPVLAGSIVEAGQLGLVAVG